MTKRASESGSVAVEALASTGFALLVLSGGLVLCMMLFARTWLKRSAYEAAVCMASGAPRSQCEWELNTEVDAALPIGRLEIQRLAVSEVSADVDMTWIAPSFSLAVHESVALPLVAAGTSI